MMQGFTKVRSVWLGLFLAVWVTAYSENGATAQRVGPADNPFEHDDFGGTPDLLPPGMPQLTTREVDSLLKRLASDDLTDRISAARDIKENAPGSEGGLRQVLFSRYQTRNTQMKRVLSKARSQADDVGGIIGELLKMSPDADGVVDVARIVVILSALQAADTLAGYKVNMEFSGLYAGVFRKYIGELMVESGLRALPALVYGRGSNDKELRMFSVKWIRDIGISHLGDQIAQIESSRRLAQLVEAYASVNDLSTIQVTLSLCNHASEHVRHAARSALRVYGQNAKWAIRREYENVHGEDPEPGASWEDWRQTLYDTWDNNREKKSQRLFEQGYQAFNAGELKKMADAYYDLLADEPFFGRRDEMAMGFLAYARQQEAHDDTVSALKFLKMARRLAEPRSDVYVEADRLLRRLQIMDLAGSGGASHRVFQEELRDSDNADTDFQRLANELDHGVESHRSEVARIICVSVLIFLAMLLVYIRLRFSRASKTKKARGL